MKTKFLVLAFSLVVIVSVIAGWAGWDNLLRLNNRNFSAQLLVQNPSMLNFYVATNGNDVSGDGTFGNPFATLEKARDAIGLQKGVSATVWIRGGTYQLIQSFALTNQDSGTANAPIIYQNYNNEEVHIIGGKKLTPANWKILQPGAIRDRLRLPAKSAVYQIDLKNDEGITDFGSLATRATQLFFDGSPMTLTKYPNTGWLKTKGPSGAGFTHYDYSDPIPGTWTNTDDAYAYGFWWYEWAAYHLKVANITNDGDYKLNFTTNPGYGITANKRFYFYNIPEELDTAGEYYIDRSTGILYFWPPSNVSLKDSYVSLLDVPLINISNVNYTTFRGLIFEDTRGQALLADTCDHLIVDSCIIRNIGGKKDWFGQWPLSPWLNYALAIKVSTNSGITNCQVYNTGDGGIYLHGGNRITQTPSHNYAKNNIVHDTGQWNMTTPGGGITINGLVGGGANEVGIGDTVSHNLIYNVPREAIYMGGDQHIIEFNEIYNTCLQASDSGAIYAGANPTEHDNVIRYNYIHDVRDIGTVGVFGVYFDARESGFKVYGNVFNNVDTPIFVNTGSNHTIANNIFVNSNSVKNDLLITAATPPPTGNKVLANIHYAPITKAPFIYTQNEPDLVKTNNWTRGDPSFINYSGKNFQLTADSPAWQLGFQRIPIEEIGPNSTAVGQDMNFDNLPNPADIVKPLKPNFQNGLKLYLPLGEGYGQDVAFDQSGNNPPNNGTLQGGVSWLGQNQGKLGNGIAIDGKAGSYISIPSSASLSAQGPRTESFWMKATPNNGIITTFGGNNSIYGAFYLNNSAPNLYLNDGNLKIWASVAPYLDGINWHHWSLVIAGAGQDDIVNAILRIDNNVIASTTVSHINPIRPWTEHRIGGGYYSINASMDEVMMWNRVLTSAEITDLYNLNIFESGTPPPTLAPNITLTKTANKTQASSGEEITYTIAYTNTGTGNATNVVITDPIPTGATYVAGSASNSGILNGSTLTWNIGNVASGTSGSVSFKAKVD